jgi:hypothetical protein
MKKTIGSAALMMMALSTTQAAPAAKEKANRLPASLPASVMAVGCKTPNFECVVAVRSYTEDGPDFTTVAYSYCPGGSTIVSGKDLNFCALPKPAML